MFFKRDDSDSYLRKNIGADNNVCLILTATVDVCGIAFMDRSDPAIRLKDYENSLEKWLTLGFAKKIVFIENSGFDLTKLNRFVGLFAIKNISIEFLSFRGQGFPRELGKGYGELMTLEYAVKHSVLLMQSDHFVKVNGRYFLGNNHTVLYSKNSRSSTHVMCDLSDNLAWADSRVFGGAKHFLNSYLCPRLKEVNDASGVFFEHVMARATHAAISDGWTWSPLPSPPEIIGVYGSGDIRYSNNAFRRILKKVFHAWKTFALKRRQPF